MLQTPAVHNVPVRSSAGIPADFLAATAPFDLTLVTLSNLGSYTTEVARVRELYFHPSLSDPSSWRWTGQKGGAGFYDTHSDAGTILFKPEACVFPKIGTVGRNDTSGFRRIIPVLVEIKNRGWLIEEPVAHLTIETGKSFYATKFRSGTSMDNFWQVADSAQRSAMSAKIGEQLALLHQRGIAHGHPHFRNWIVDGDRTFLIDAKGCTFEPDYPHTYRTGRTVTFEQSCANDRKVAEAELTECGAGNKFSGEFAKVYGIFRAKND